MAAESRQSEYRERQQITSVLLESLSGLPVEYRAAVAEALADDFEVPGQSPEPGRREFRLRRWVIDSDELDLLQSLAGTAAGILALEISESPHAIASITVAVLNFIRLVRSCVRRGAILTSRQAKILALLAANPEGLTPTEVAERLMAAEDHLLVELRGLEAVRLRDGSVISLARSDQLGRWTTC